MVLGASLGLLAGFTRSWVGDLVMRLTDIVMSFPSTLLAVVILYTFRPSILTLVAVLAITRLPVYIRTTRAEVLEIRERMFVERRPRDGRLAAAHRAAPRAADGAADAPDHRDRRVRRS